MKKTFALIFLLILSANPSLSFALDETVRELQNIDFQNNVTISLSDGTSCIAHTDPCEIGILQTWNIGDSIDITKHSSFTGLILINQNSDILYSPKIELTKASVENLPKIVKKSKIRNDDFSNRFTLYLTLSDGSIWEYDLWSFENESFNSWKIGDRVLIQIRFGERAQIINYNLVFSRNYYHASKSDFKKTSE